MKLHALLFTSLLVASSGHFACADPVDYIANGSFEAAGGSFSGWTTTGTTAIQTTAFASPTVGSFKAFISSASGSVAASVLSDFFGGALFPDTPGGAAVEGSGIKQTFTALETVALSFDYKYVSQEDIGSGYDATFFYLDGAVMLLADSESAGVVPISGLPLRYKNGIPYRTYTVGIAPGTHTVGFGTYDTGDDSGDSALIVDRIQAVPEPGNVAFGIGLGLVCLMSRISRRARAQA